MNIRYALIALNLSAFFFGLSGILGKLVSTSPAFIVFGRAAFAVIALSLLMSCGKGFGWQRLPWRSARLLLVSSVILAGHWLTFFISVKAAGVAVATLGFASFPAFTTLFESLGFNERISRAEISLIGLICLGLILVCPAFDLDSGSTRGFLWGIASGALLALLIVCNRITAVNIRPVQAACVQNGLITLLMLPFALPELPLVSLQDGFYLALLGVFCTAIAHSLMVTSLRWVKARAAAVFFALEPVYAILFAWWWFNEQPTLRICAGAALIIFSVILYTRRKS